ncbi:hypothetical protein LXA43DRAFT_989520 [Ganoderma leucocontextum]|nr:hypothetical protein LXA43DRAFT_989520 [Ganoderma leucocontextum]
MTTMAQNEKEKGNAAFKAGDFPTAIGHYTAAFLADPSNPTYPLNRAAAYLKLGKNEDAERDCDAVIRLDTKNVKGYFRRGQARVALQKLKEAESDLQEASKLEPSNDSVKQELSRVRNALKSVPVTPKNRKPVDISTPAPAVATPPKRRRIPITIVEPGAGHNSATSGATRSLTTDTGLLTAVSSRPLGKSPSPPSAVSQPPTSGPSSAFTVPDASTAPKPPPQTFREAKAAREELRPRGGIFRSDGKSSLFYASSPSNGNVNAPKREIPETLVAFTRIWNELTTEEERWDVLRQIPATRLPVLFKTSLSASLLAAILHSLRTALEAGREDIPVVRAYMVNLPRVPRFTTVSLMMSTNERADAQVVWDLLGRSRGDGVEGEMDKRKEDGSRSAWGCH